MNDTTEVTTIPQAARLDAKIIAAEERGRALRIRLAVESGQAEGQTLEIHFDVEAGSTTLKNLVQNISGGREPKTIGELEGRAIAVTAKREIQPGWPYDAREFYFNRAWSNETR